MSTLADETRYQIYQYILQNKKYYTVQEIAELFSIHPNVARLHLTKLCEIGIVQGEFIKSGKGGRPGRAYHATERGIVISFPNRDFETLLNWTLQFISEIGNEAIEKLKLISYQDGYNEMKAHFDSKKTAITINEKIDFLTKNATNFGYVPTIVKKDGNKQIFFEIDHCPFKEQISEHSHLICKCHESYLKGQIDALFPNNDFIQITSMENSCNTC